MRKVILFFAASALVILPVLFYILPGRIFFASVLLFFLGGVALAAREYKDSIKSLRERSDLLLADYDKKKKTLGEDSAREDGRIFELRAREMMMVSLYDITKKMSPDLTFGEIFNALSAFLKEYFVFKKSELLILKEEEGRTKIDKAYKMYKDDGIRDDGAQADYAGIISLFAKDKKEVYIPKEGLKSFGAIPLLSENKFVGILTVEDMPRTDFDRLIIVATQFALEMKKVLLYETVEALAITDSLTSLYTRRYFFERLGEELNRSKKHNFKFAFLMIDIDDFKICNDTHGHLVGDVILRDVSRIIKESIREIDLAARYGGEEFSVILPETDKKGAFFAAERIRKKVEENIIKAYDEKLKVTVSAGLAIYPEDASTVEDIVEKADKALYAAKSSGKNIVCEYKN